MLLWDAPAQRSSTGGYPWLVEGSSSTKAYIKNVTNEEQNYVSYLTWENGGMYMIGLRQIAPHQTIEIDVRKLRNEQTPDEEGRVIPLEISKGQIQWAFKMGGTPDETVINQISLVGQMEQTDTTKGISTSYFCQNCCEEDGFGVIEPGNSEVDMGSVVQYESYEDSYSCYGGFYRYQTTNSAQWSSSNQSVATISSPGRVTTVGVGTTNIKARFNVTQHYVNQPCYGGGDLSPEESGVLIEQEGAENTEKRERVPNLPAACDCICIYPSVSPNANLTVIPGVQKLQYQEPNTTNFIDITNTLYILKGTAVTFKALPNPANATFPNGQPTWSGTSGATGTGQTKSVTFNTKSTSTTDYKTVIASTGTPKIVNVIVYELTGTLNPQDYFNSRSTDRYGLKEDVNLGFLVTPNVTAQQMGDLTWKIISGSGTLNNTTTGLDIYTAPKIVGDVILKIEIQMGPSKGTGLQYNKTIVAPSGAYIIKSLALPDLIHCQGFSSVGFMGDVKLLPKDVSFANLYFREGGGRLNANGFYISDDGRQHQPTAFMTQITDCNIVLGCNAFLDEIYTGKWSPDPVLGFYYGNATWNIDWLYAFNADINPIFNGQTRFTGGVHYQESNNIGTASIQKAGAGPFSKQVGEVDSNCQ